ncbi:MAG: A/G-specific adenine glycosylase [Candidatus Eremiobacteraeota bacterium]|nr:A/G-specific adenine glycosylase [Candidatus Eremiobacteraeota bacterium]
MKTSSNDMLRKGADLQACESLTGSLDFDPSSIEPADIRRFRELIMGYYRSFGRSLPWRTEINPYRVTVSEVMLQQTQVERVRQKYEPFIARYPGFASLAAAPLSDVLEAWQGLGYNRRALALKKIAALVINTYDGRLPSDPEILRTLPGIGDATARSICVFAFNLPLAFIETNIRALFIHFFYRRCTSVHDRDILPLVEKTLERENPREWYHALMDYGVFLKKQLANPGKKSAHHRRQSPFQGSHRQVRGLLLRTLLASYPLSREDLAGHLEVPIEAVARAAGELLEEGFIGEECGLLSIR